MIIYKQGNILETDADAIAHGCNCEGIMNAGLAKMIRKTYPDMYVEYLSLCREGMAEPGNLHFYSNPKRPHIVNLFTQKTVGEGARLEYVRQSLEQIASLYQKWSVNRIAMPRVGCGLGKLKWKDVKPVIQKAFANMPDLEIIVYIL